MPGVQVELRDPDQRIVIAKTETDGAGQVTFPDVPIGRYLITASGAGFVLRVMARAIAISAPVGRTVTGTVLLRWRQMGSFRNLAGIRMT